LSDTRGRPAQARMAYQSHRGRPSTDVPDRAPEPSPERALARVPPETSILRAPQYCQGSHVTWFFTIEDDAAVSGPDDLVVSG
jgi:hypothetical protein